MRQRAIEREGSSMTKNPEGSHLLAGAGLHFKDEHGRVRNQAMIKAVITSGNTAVGDLVLIQYFEWLSGERSTQRLIPLVELASSDRWVFYTSVDEMNDHYRQVDDRRNELITRQLDEQKRTGKKEAA